MSTPADAPIRLGTRRSALARAQSQLVADALAEASGRRVELVPITSEGDTTRASLSEIGGRGVFATRLREALVAGQCDVLVHSLKDLPTEQPEGLVIGATTAREDARDVVVTRDGTPLHRLKPGTVVGTGSPRRVAQVHQHNRRVAVEDLRGNVDSRLGRVRGGELDAVVLAAAGLVRLGAVLDDLEFEPLGLLEWPTAPGQGALAVETTTDAEPALLEAISRLDDEPTRAATEAERAVLRALDAGCTAPLGAHAQVAERSLRIRAIVYSTDGAGRVALDHTEPLPPGYARNPGRGDGADTADGADPTTRATRAGTDVGHRLLEAGAADLVPRESIP